MAVTEAQNPLIGENTCGSLLKKLQEIWDEVGESDEERDKMLLQLEQECLDVYKRKVEHAAKSRAQLLQALSDAKLELSTLLSALGEKGFAGIPDNTSGTIKEQLAAIAPALEQLWQQKEERIKDFSDVQSQIQKICGEITGSLNLNDVPAVDESDLTLKKFEEYQSELQELQKEKSDRLQKVFEFVSTVHDLCAVLGMDFFSTVTEVHPSLNDSTGVQSKSISNETLARLANTVLTLKEDKKQRLHKLQELASQLIDLWNLMDTPPEERKLFDHVTCNISASVDEVTIPGALALDLIEQAEVEVERLDQLKASRMKEIAFKKQSELEVIFANAHIEIDSDAAREKIMALIDSGDIEPTELFNKDYHSLLLSTFKHFIIEMVSSNDFNMLILIPLLVSSLMVMNAFAAGNLNQHFDITWGDGRAKILNNGELLTLSLDKASGSGFQSKNEYLFGKIDMQLKLVPGNSAGTVTAYYLSSKGPTWDEIDYEFLGNVSGEPYILHTNVFSQGKGNREQQFYLWFDPTADFHTYSIIWNPQRIIFSVDGTPIREFKNSETIGVPFPKNQPMRIYSSLWNADNWATRGGLVKTDWTKAPFTASYRNFNAQACIWSSGASSCGSTSSASKDSARGSWLSQELDATGQGRLKWVQKNYMIYNYCKDTKRFPQGLPPECNHS